MIREKNDLNLALFWVKWNGFWSGLIPERDEGEYIQQHLIDTTRDSYASTKHR